MQFILVLILFIALLIAALTLQNQEPMAINLFFWTFSISKILVILGSAFAGALAVFLAGMLQRLIRMNTKKDRQAKEKLESKPPPPAETPAAPAVNGGSTAAAAKNGENAQANG